MSEPRYGLVVARRNHVRRGVAPDPAALDLALIRTTISAVRHA